MRKIDILLMIISIFSSSVYAEAKAVTVFSEEKVIDLAIASSEDFKIANYDNRKLKQQYVQARSTIYPQVSGTLSWVHNSQYANADMRDYSASAALGASQIVYSFGKVKAAIEGAKNAFDAGKFNKESTKKDIVYAAKQAYYATILAQQVYGIVDSSYENTLENKRILEERSSGGRVSKRDNIKIAADVAARKPQLNTAKAQLDSAMNTLKVLIGFDCTEEIELAEAFDSDWQLLDYFELYKQFKFNEPRLKAAKEQVAFADNYVKLKKAEHYPSISAFYDYSKSGNDNSTYVGDDQMSTNSTVGLKVSVPIFSGWSTTAQRKQAEIEKEKIALAYAKLEESLGLELENAVTVYNQLIETLKSNNEAVHLAEESFKLSQDMFRSGQVSLTDLNDSELQLTNQKLAKEQTLYDLSVTKAKIERMTKGDS